MPRERHSQRRSPAGRRRPFARTEALRGEPTRWQEAHVRLAEMGCRAVGSAEPELDARIVVSALIGLMLLQLTQRRDDFEETVLRPALTRLFARLAAAHEERVAAPTTS